MLFPSQNDVNADRHQCALLPRRGLGGGVTLVGLVLWALLGHPRLGGEAMGQGSTNSTTTTSFSTSSETVTSTATVRADTFATRIVASDQTGGVVFDQTFAVPFADPAVQTALATERMALQGGLLPALVIVNGPTRLERNESLIGSSTMTLETGRTDTFNTDLENTIGPTCIGTGNRDVPNGTPCDVACTGTSEAPPNGNPTCVPAGTVNLNVQVDTHTVIQELQTTTDTYLTSERYTLAASLLDHFVLYKVKPTKGTPKLAKFGPLTLNDALGGADYDVTKLPALGLPADQNAEGRADEFTHLAQYAVKRRKGAPKFAKLSSVAIANQCGALTLQLAKPESLLVPVAKDLSTPPRAIDPLSHEVDHFLCYKAKAKKKRTDGTPVAALPKGVQVDAVDQFQTRRYDLKKVTRLCVPVTTAGTPVTKSGAPVAIVATALRHPAGHLVCYQAKAAKKTIPQNGCGPLDPKNKGTKIVPAPPKHQKHTGVQINGPLGPAALDTAKEIEVCIPSTATLP